MGQGANIEYFVKSEVESEVPLVRLYIELNFKFKKKIGEQIMKSEYQ